MATSWRRSVARKRAPDLSAGELECMRELELLLALGLLWGLRGPIDLLLFFRSLGMPDHFMRELELMALGLLWGCGASPRRCGASSSSIANVSRAGRLGRRADVAVEQGRRVLVAVGRDARDGAGEEVAVGERHARQPWRRIRTRRGLCLVSFNARRVGLHSLCTVLEEMDFVAASWDALFLQECDLFGHHHFHAARPLALLGHHLAWASESPGTAVVVHRRRRGCLVSEWAGRRAAGAAVSVGGEGTFVFAGAHSPIMWSPDSEWDDWLGDMGELWNLSSGMAKTKVAIGGDFNLQTATANRQGGEFEVPGIEPTCHYEDRPVNRPGHDPKDMAADPRSVLPRPSATPRLRNHHICGPSMARWRSLLGAATNALARMAKWVATHEPWRGRAADHIGPTLSHPHSRGHQRCPLACVANTHLRRCSESIGNSRRGP